MIDWLTLHTFSDTTCFARDAEWGLQWVRLSVSLMFVTENADIRVQR